jgi:hypothetical protein
MVTYANRRGSGAPSGDNSGRARKRHLGLGEGLYLMLASKKRRLPIPRRAGLTDELERLDRGHVTVEMAKLGSWNHGAVAAVGTGHAKRVAVAFDAVQVSRPDQLGLTSVSIRRG